MVKSFISMQSGKIDKKEMIKMSAGMLIGVGADVTVSLLLKHLLPPVKGRHKIAVAIGSFILSMKIGEDCETYFYKIWDETKAALDEAKTVIEQDEAEGQVETNGGDE